MSRYKAKSKQKLEALGDHLEKEEVEVDKLKTELKEMEEVVPTETAHAKALMQELGEIQKEHAQYEPNNQQRLKETKAQLKELQKEKVEGAAGHDQLQALLEEACKGQEGAEAEVRTLVIKLEEAKKKEEEDMTKMTSLDSYVQTLNRQVAEQIEERENWRREIAGVQSVLKTSKGVYLSRETYGAWELQILDLKDEVRRAKKLLAATENIRASKVE